jgi:hypothetical protein
MKNNTLLCTMILLGASLSANASPKDDVIAAAKKLGEKPNYGWTATSVSPGGGFTPGPVSGKTEKDGFAYVTSSFGDNSIEVALKGDKGAVKGQEGWQSLAEADQAEGPGRFLAIIARNTKVPAATAADLAAHTTDLKLVDGACVGELTSDGVKAQLAFGGPDGGPTIANPKGSVKFWLKDGLLAKYEVTLQASMNFNGNEFPVDQTTTVEVKDVGTTKVELPADAKKKMP